MLTNADQHRLSNRAGQSHDQGRELGYGGRVGLYAGFCREAPKALHGRPSISACRRRQALAVYPQTRAGRPQASAQEPEGSLLTLLRVGFAEPPRSPEALVVSYTTVSPLPDRSPAVCFLWHCPAGHPGLPLATTLPCGARTFLGGRKTHRRDRPADSSAVRTIVRATT